MTVPGMSEIEFLTYPISFKLYGMGFLKIPFTVNLIPFNQKILFPLVQQKIPFNDQTGLVVNEIEQDL
jgi:hypothetical protein